jgi:hypothetical protein
MNLPKLLVSLFAFAALALGAKAAPLTNADIIKMTGAGLGPDIIISTIHGSTDKQFDTSVDALIALKQAKVDEAVIKVIQTPSAPAPQVAAPSDAVTQTDWNKVILTKNNDDVKGLTRLGEVKGSSMGPFFTQNALRGRASNEIKKEAAKLGASIVLVQTDDFQGTPLNNVSMIGVAYK